MVDQLLGGAFSPVTNTLGFLRCEAGVAARAFVKWQEPIQQNRGALIATSPVQGTLSSLIKALLPLTSVERRRFLFVPTRSEWCAFLDNGHQGTDAFAPLSYLAQQLSCEGLRATYAPIGSTEFPATILELYAPEETNFLNIRRSVSAAKDGAAWRFSADGEVQPFERIEAYSRRRISERFDGEMLRDYLRAMNIEAFDNEFYAPDQKAMLVTKTGAIAPGSQEYGFGAMPFAEVR